MNRFTKQAFQYEASVSIASEMAEKILRRTENIIYSMKLDRMK